MMWDRQQRTNEAIELVVKHTDDSDPDKNLLYQLYYRDSKYEDAVGLQKTILKNYEKSIRKGLIQEYASTIRNKKVQMYIHIASCYLKLAQYKEAENYYKLAISIAPTNFSLKRGLALCYYQQGNTEAAIKELKEIVNSYQDAKSKELLEQIQSPSQKTTFDGKTIDMILANIAHTSSVDLDKFTQHYLRSCGYKGVRPDRLKNNKYEGSDGDRNFDIDKLENAATELGTSRPEERSGYYLSAAKIIVDCEAKDKYLHRYLCRSFASRADSAGYERRPFDTIKTFYLQALKVYDTYHSDENLRADEQDAINALYRYLYAHLGMGELHPKLAAVRVGGLDNQLKQLKESCEDVFEKNNRICGNYDNIFEAIKIAISQSPQYASKRFSKSLWENRVL